MPDIYYEESVSQQNVKTAKKFYIVFTVAAALCVVCAIFALISLYVFLTFTSADDVTGKQILITCAFYGVLLIASIVFSVLFFKKRHTFYVSYDYTFVSGDLRISKVFHQRKRKNLYALSDDRLIKIGRVGSQSYLKLKAAPENKEDILTPNEEAAEGKEFFYIYAATAAGKRILVLECRLELIASILRYMNKNILESEFNRK